VVEIEWEIFGVFDLHDFAEGEVVAGGVAFDSLELLSDVLFYAGAYLMLAFGVSHLFMGGII
jgi:hypothetical protein